MLKNYSLLYLLGGVLLAGFLTGASAQTPSADTLKVLAIRVSFQTDNAATTTGDGSFNLGSDTARYAIDPPPHNRSYFMDHLTFLSNYYRKISRGKLEIKGTVYPLSEEGAYQLPHPMTYYNPNTTPEAINQGLAELVRDAFLQANEDPAIDFSAYQSFIIFHAGVGKDVDLGYDETPQDIPSLFITEDFLNQYLNGQEIIVDGVKIHNALLLPETENQDGLELGLNGILVSNFGSQLGFLDLFSPQTRRPGVGRFGLMDAGLFNGDGLLPAIPMAWTRIEAGWETPQTIRYAAGDELAIHHPLSSQEPRVYRFPINESEYFLVENRWAGEVNFDSVRAVMASGRSDYPNAREVLETHFAEQVVFSPRGVLIDVKNPDLGLPGNGCLIWHIDEQVIARYRDENKINNDPEHRGVDLEEADGSQDIGEEFDFLSPGSASANGWVLDMWYADNSAPLFKRDGNKFSANTMPNSRSYYNNANSHITLSDFSDGDSVMTFKANLNIIQKGYPKKLALPELERVSLLRVLDLQDDNTDDILLFTDKGELYRTPREYTDSLRYLGRLGENFILPPVIFKQTLTGALPQRMIWLLKESGTMSGYILAGDTLLQEAGLFFLISDSASTYPVAVETEDGGHKIYWGTCSGKLYELTLPGAGLPFDTTSYQLNGRLTHVHISKEGDPISITEHGFIYRGNNQFGDVTVPDFPLLGDAALGVTAGGELVAPFNPDFRAAESGDFTITGPGAMLLGGPAGTPQPFYIFPANNRVLVLNYNLTMLENFPVSFYNPPQSVELNLSPVVGWFFDADLAEGPGILVADPDGIISGFDLQGRLLSDFPLAAGAPISCAPVVLDLDGDGDTEVAAVTEDGTLFIWDLGSEYKEGLWNQNFADLLNSGKPAAAGEVSGTPSRLVSGALLPAEKVYNWPNPNTDNYTYIRYYLTGEAEVSIRIYDLAGDLVESFIGPGNALTDNEIRWDLTGVQSGVYLARIEARGAGGSEVRIIKIAVVK
ncbi:MAG: hypothetical protein Kow0037_06900 [Calditrichia bacterium]